MIIYVDDLQECLRTYKEIWELHQKASIFIDIGVAPSQRSVISDRVTLRRIYCPAFRTTLTSSEHLQLNKEEFEGFIDKPDEYCRNYLNRVTKKSIDQTLPLWETKDETTPATKKEEAEDFSQYHMPDKRDLFDFVAKSPKSWQETVSSLPNFDTLNNTIQSNTEYDLFIGALGFEERTTEAISRLVSKNVQVKDAVLFEFDMYFKATEERRDKYYHLIREITGGNPHRPMNAPLSTQISSFPEQLDNLLNTISNNSNPLKILFDCTSCPSSIHSQTLAILLKNNCDLTILYSEAKTYYPTKREWEAGRVKPKGKRIQCPFEGLDLLLSHPLYKLMMLGNDRFSW